MKTKENKKTSASTGNKTNKSDNGKKAGVNQQSANKKGQNKGGGKAETVERNMETDQE